MDRQLGCTSTVLPQLSRTTWLWAKCAYNSSALLGAKSTILLSLCISTRHIHGIEWLSTASNWSWWWNEGGKNVFGGIRRERFKPGRGQSRPMRPIPHPSRFSSNGLLLVVLEEIQVCTGWGSTWDKRTNVTLSWDTLKPDQTLCWIPLAPLHPGTQCPIGLCC